MKKVQISLNVSNGTSSTDDKKNLTWLQGLNPGEAAQVKDRHYTTHITIIKSQLVEQGRTSV